jgi:polysaccharide transporter, PST family
VKTKLPESIKQLTWIYLLAIAGLGIPLVTIPYLARVLGPEAWGRVLGAQAVATLLVAIGEFGFNLSGTRQVAQARAAGQSVRSIVSDVLSAKIFCTLLAGIVWVMFLQWMPLFRHHRLILAMALVWGISGGLNFGWYFQGTGRAVLFFAIDSLARLIGVGATFLMVHRPEDDWLALAANATVACLALLATFPVVLLETGCPRLTLRGARASILWGGHMAMYVLLAGIRDSVNRVVLGFLAPPATVAIFGNAERITDILNRGCEPASRVIYPIMCREVVTSLADARRSLLRAVAFLGIAMGSGVVVTMIGADLIIRLLCGSSYDQSAVVLRLLLLLPLLKAASLALNTFWALPLGFDRHLAPCVLLAAGVTIGAAIVLVPSFGALGMAAAAILSETTFLSASAVFLAWRRCFPFLPLGHPLASGKEMGRGIALGPSATPSGSVLLFQEQTS